MLAQNRIVSIARKEFLHIIHDPRTLLIIFLMPVVQLVMFGYALNLDIQQVNLAVIDYSHTPDSRKLIDEFEGSTFFKPFMFGGKISEVDELFKLRKAHAALVIRYDFSRQLQREKTIPVQVLIDASDPNAATIIRQYVNRVITQFNLENNQSIPLPFEIRSSVLFNPDMKSVYFFVPGLVALLLIMISALLTSIAITREKETGTLEQILVSPVRAYEIILGKVLPYIFLAFLNGALILVIGIFVFRVPFQGSVLLLFLLTVLYVITALSLGLMISTIARTQQVAMMVAMVATLLPTIILSGFIFPIASMPRWLQFISYIIPARFYLLIVRGVMLKGSTFRNLLEPALFLAMFSTILLLISIKKFNTNLEK